MIRNWGVAGEDERWPNSGYLEFLKIIYKNLQTERDPGYPRANRQMSALILVFRIRESYTPCIPMT